MSRIRALTRHRGTRLIVGAAWSREWLRTMFRLRSFPRPQRQGPCTRWRAPKIRAPILAEASRFRRQPSPTSDGKAATVKSAERDDTHECPGKPDIRFRHRGRAVGD